MFRALHPSLLVVSVLLAAACGDKVETKALPTGAPAEPVAQQPAPAHNNQTILFYENRVKNDPDDYIAHNKLASEYLGQMRLTGDTAYLELALKAAQASLAI